MWKKYISNKNEILEVIFVTIFLFFSLKFLGIPDKYDFYIYIFLFLIFLINLFFYLLIIIKELDKITHHE